VITIAQHALVNGLCTANALRHVLARHLEMHAAAMGALGSMHREEAAHLAKDPVEGACLVAVRGLDRIAVHGIAGPDHRAAFTLHFPNQGRQLLLHLIGTHSRNQGEPTRFVRRIK
jgi:hypothetical protein